MDGGMGGGGPGGGDANQAAIAARRKDYIAKQQRCGGYCSLSQPGAVLLLIYARLYKRQAVHHSSSRPAGLLGELLILQAPTISHR